MFGKKRRGKVGRPGTASHEDLVERVFTATAPNQLWLTDITEHGTGEGKVYLCRRPSWGCASRASSSGRRADRLLATVLGMPRPWRRGAPRSQLDHVS